VRPRAALALTSALVILSVPAGWTLETCGEKDEPAPAVRRPDVRALTAAGLAAVGSDASVPAISFSADGRVLRIAIGSLPDGLPILGLLAPFDGMRAEIEQWCPKPALLRCRPSVRGWAWPRSRQAVERSVAALGRLVARTYDEPAVVRRRDRVTRIVTANGELLAAVRTAPRTVTFSFGGLDPPRGAADTAARGLEIRAGAAALAAMRPALPPAARRALAGARHLVVSTPLP
jgi:hypothetical protein